MIKPFLVSWNFKSLWSLSTWSLNLELLLLINSLYVTKYTKSCLTLGNTPTASPQRGQAGYFSNKKVMPLLYDSRIWGKFSLAQETVSWISHSEYFFWEAVCLCMAAPGYGSKIPCAEATPFIQAGSEIMHSEATLSSVVLASSCRCEP